MDVALVGHKGYWGSLLLGRLRACPGISVIALVDPREHDPAVCALTFPSIESLLRDHIGRNIQSVIIATPPHTHFEIAAACLEAGKHVLLEKPMTVSSIDAQLLVDLAAEKGVKLGVDHTFLFSEHVRVLKRVMWSGQIGTPLRIQSDRLNLGKFQDSGVVWDLAPHDFAMALYLTDHTPTFRSAEVLGHLDFIPDTAYISLSFGEISYSLNLSWLYPRKVRTTVVLGTEGMIEYDMLSKEPLVIYDKRAKKGEKEWIHSSSWKQSFQEEAPEPLSILCREWKNHCLYNAPFPSPGEQGARVVSLIEQVLEKSCPLSTLPPSLVLK